MGTRTSGSEGGGGETTSRKRGTAPRRRPYIDDRPPGRSPILRGGSPQRGLRARLWNTPIYASPGIWSVKVEPKVKVKVDPCSVSSHERLNCTECVGRFAERLGEVRAEEIENLGELSLPGRARSVARTGLHKPPPQLRLSPQPVHSLRGGTRIRGRHE